jgi:hypothetical protein
MQTNIATLYDVSPPIPGENAYCRLFGFFVVIGVISSVFSLVPTIIVTIFAKVEITNETAIVWTLINTLIFDTLWFIMRQQPLLLYMPVAKHGYRLIFALPIVIVSLYFLTVGLLTEIGFILLSSLAIYQMLLSIWLMTMICS